LAARAVHDESLAEALGIINSTESLMSDRQFLKYRVWQNVLDIL
jgi:hypothetical protein